MSYTAQPISIISNHKFITLPAISTLRDFSLSQNRQPILRNLIFTPFTKVASAHPSINYFQIFWYFVGVLWHTGSCSHLVISGSMVRSQPSAYTPRQGILSTIVSLNPGVLNGYLAGFFLKMPQRH